MEFFEIFPWDKNFETGIELIDEQHKKLVDILNQLAAHLANRSQPIVLNKIFDELADYADYHFKSEEKIWDAHFCKDDEWNIDHEKTHESFITQVIALKNREIDKPLDDVIQDVVSFLSKWLAYHILDTDKRMAKAVQALESGDSLEQAKNRANEEMSGSMRILIDTVLTMYESLSTRTVDLMREKTLRKQAEQALVASEERWKFVLDGSENVWDWDIESRDKADTEMEPSIFDLLSNDASLPRRDLSIHPADIDSMKADLQVHLEGSSEFFVNKHRVLRKGGGWSWVLSRGKVVSRDDSGKALRMVGTHTDITKQELASLIYENSSQAMFVTDVNNVIIGINAAFTTMTGYTEEEAIGKNPQYFSSKRHNKEFYKKMWEAINTTRHWEGEIWNRRKDGEVFPEFLNINTVVDANGLVDHYIALFSDISGEKEAEVEHDRLQSDLQQAQKMESLGQLTGGIAHDFNNLLAIINGYSSLTLEQCLEQGNERLAGYMRHVSNASDRATKLVSQMLSFSRSDQGDDLPVELSPLVKEDIKLLRASLPSTIEIKSDIATELPNVVMDPTQLHQILMNLAVNARDAMQGTGTLSIKLGCVRGIDTRSPVTYKPVKGDWIELAVTDTGSGIDAQTAEQIFQPFFTTKEKGKGTGMGLSVIYGIMENNGGHILLESELGKGSTFRMLFAPLQKDENMQTEDGQAAVKLPRGDDSEILVVDDELSLGIFMEELLKAYGYRATSMTSSPEALDLFKQDPARFSMLITDQTMPVMTGMELIANLREIRPDLPVILCTGYSDKVDAKGAADLDIPFFEKPVDDEKLLKTMAERLSNTH